MKSLQENPKCLGPKMLSATSGEAAQTRRKTNPLKAASGDRSVLVAGRVSDLPAQK